MNSLIWAIILIIIGIEILLKVFFKTSFSLFKLAIGVFCIYTGLNMLHQKNPDGTENKMSLQEQFQKSYNDSYKIAQVLLKKAHKASHKLMDEINQ
jgi:hypothetical protein